MADFQYPIGKFQRQDSITQSEREEYIKNIAATPANLRLATKNLNDQQLDTPYRPGGWTVRQVVHHVPDSHLNAYIRFKLAITEPEPTIKAYEEQLWAELFDARTLPIESSLQLLESLHQRWVAFLNSLQPADFSKIFYHPVNGKMNLDALLQLYSWHGQHHIAHITSLRQRMKW